MAMFLKVMHDGADEFLAEADSDATYSLYGDVVECHFKRFPPEGDPSHLSSIKAEAFIRVREPVKTANVPGFVEVEKHIMLDGDAFLMNEQGRTISKFKLAGYRAPAPRAIMNGDHAQFEIEHANTKPQDRPDWPLPSFDAQDWAKAFVKMHGGDEALMLSWFANALMRGLDEQTARARAAKTT